ncbi:hypothetical protein CS022_07465 [Veronia nyctiphanis]|uniref:Uncharacterized protein n=1 Tax=Veronia nyctiphanis TaxID=1278244 RepID=A0A4Q0YUI6_9GAMM|nr:calcium-binding protein [Veronia nyctiphanis]RXJ73824.1 hypothetical protein CS022_07465 [Veronia nyctiphanis]
MVELGNAVKGNVEYTFGLSGNGSNPADLSDIESVTLTNENGAALTGVNLTDNGDGTYTVTLNGSVTNFNVVVQTMQDSVFEGDEGFKLDVSTDITLATTGNDTTGIATISDGDFDNVIIEGVGGINSVYMSNGYVTSSHGHTTPNGATPSVTINGELKPGANNPVIDGNDYISTGGDNDHVEGGLGNDTIYLGSGSSWQQQNIPPQGVDASLFVTYEDSQLFQGGNEDNTLQHFTSPSWADAAHGGQGNDSIFGEADVDLISGGSGNDYLDGGEDDDFLRGGSGDDTIIGGSGDDIMRGDAGNDTFVFSMDDVIASLLSTDIIVKFDNDNSDNEVDTLDLGNLVNYTADEESPSDISAEFAGDTLTLNFDTDNDGDIDQSIVLEGVNGDISQGIVINTLINGKEATLTVTDSDTTAQTAPEIKLDFID